MKQSSLSTFQEPGCCFEERDSITMGYPTGSTLLNRTGIASKGKHPTLEEHGAGKTLDFDSGRFHDVPVSVR